MQLSLREAVRVLRAGGVVAYPTETVYGLGCDVTSEAAVSALAKLKGRPAERGFSALVSGVDALEAWAGPVSARARALAEAFWPGPLTLVLPVTGSDPSGPGGRLGAVATEHGVGFRCSSHPAAQALAAASPVPVASTSCNRTGEPPADSIAEIEAAFGPELGVLDAEPPGGGLPSTVVRVAADGTLTLLREGALPPGRVRDVAARA